jgi:hypothetical protein
MARSVDAVKAARERWRTRKANRSKKVRFWNRRLKRAEARLKGLAVELAAAKAAQDPGERALAYLGRYVGKTERPAGSNDAPFLASWRLKLPTLAWMRGQPWCGFACIAAWQFGAGIRLPDGVVFTPNIVVWANRGEHFTRVRPEDARPGDLVVFNFPGGSTTADHVGLARGPARGGVIPTREGNTSSNDGGSQANGGGVFDRARPVGLIAVVARPIGGGV